MSVPPPERIAFDVQTDRILQLLASEIYDSPNAFLRENVQNAYDAILMRCTAQNTAIADHKIEITVAANKLSVRDDGIGMTEDVLKNNFWKAGSSGKRSELAQRSGVIGTFGIGAMANFGVCTALRVETRHIDSTVTLVSFAKREELRIAQDCIELQRLSDDRPPGTIIIAELNGSFNLSEEAVCAYLAQYVRFLPVPLLVNGRLISQHKFEADLAGKAEGYDLIAQRAVSRGAYSGTLRTFVNPQARILARLHDIALSGNPLDGEVFMVQGGGQTLGFRNLFGLAPIPVSSTYALGGFVNLNILHPTAGREALSRESIQHVAEIVAMIEEGVSVDFSEHKESDENQQFQQYILSRNLTSLAKNVTISVLPSKDELPLGLVGEYEPQKQKHYFAGSDPTILRRFGTENANLLHVSPNNPRRSLQIRYLEGLLKIPQVPDRAVVERIAPSRLTVEEGIFIIRIRGVLLDDYFMPDVDVALANISHGVEVHVEIKGKTLEMSIARDMSAARMVIEAYRSAPEVFGAFVKDFVREHIYKHVRDHVPSSTKQGRDALLKRLKENEELYRYDETEYGGIESLLADYLSGKIKDFGQVLQSAAGQGAGQHQEVRREQVGTVEQELPGIIESPNQVSTRNEFEAAPPIMRPEISSNMKVLTVEAEHPKLNNFRMFLALSDRLTRNEGQFMSQPHTTNLMWGSHRIIYIFADSSGELRLYYDIKLKEPLGTQLTGGAMFPTTTIVTKDRIYVPVPKALEPAFKIVDGAKEFHVRFDTIP